ncbi:MAG: DNA polymerase III subunit chi [Chlamydiales bacterium]|nr:DNA polymerase III subunit chi [Chlamydiales bacterium]
MAAIVTFWKVIDAKQKVSCVCTLVHRFFQQAQRQLIAVPNQQVADYIDKLIWRFPKEGFVPHAVSSEPLQAAVVITTSNENVNNAGIVINLCPSVTLLGPLVAQIHELYDTTDPAKEELSRQRKAEYEQQGLTVSVCPWT